MTDKMASRSQRSSGWQLLAEFVAATPSVSDRQLVGEVTEAVQSLGLQKVQLEQICKAFVQAVGRATRGGHSSRQLYPVHVRIWALGTRDGRGWGFFLVAKQDHDPQRVHADSGHLVELFLYQERDLS